MAALLWTLLQLLSYSVWEWLLFVAVTVGAAYKGGRLGVITSHIAIACWIYFSDMAYQEAHSAEMDRDAVFALGILARVLLINTVLLPVVAAVLRRKESQSQKRASAGGANVMPWK